MKFLIPEMEYALTQLIGITWDHPRAYNCLVAASNVYEAHTGVAVCWEKRSLQAFADAPIRDLAEEYDLIVLDHPHVGQIAQSECLVPLPQSVEAADSIGNSFESYEWSGLQWAYPIDAACQMAVRRADLGKQFPDTWEDLLKNNAAEFGLVTPLLPVDAFDMMLTLIAGRGEEKMAQSPTQFCSEQNGLWALGIIRALYKLGPSEAVTWNPIHVLEMLSTTDEFAASPCLFGYINYARPGFRNHTLTYCDLPLAAGRTARRGILGGAGLGVSSLRGRVRESVDFAKWVSSENTQSNIYLNNEGQPAHRGPWIKFGQDSKYGGFFGGAFTTMDQAWTRPRDEWFLHFVDDVCDVFPDFLLKDQNDEIFLRLLNKLYQKWIGGIS